MGRKGSWVQKARLIFGNDPNTSISEEKAVWRIGNIDMQTLAAAPKAAKSVNRKE